MNLVWTILFVSLSGFQLVLALGNLFDGIIDNKNWDDGLALVHPIKDPFGDPLDIEGSIGREIVENIKTAQIKKKCDCGNNRICGCCILLTVKNETSSKASACFNVTELVGKKKVEISLIFNNQKLYTKNVGERDRCGTIPYTVDVARVCLTIYNVTMNAKGIHACVKLSVRLVNKEAVTFDFNCLLLSKGGLSVEKDSDSPGTGLVSINVPGAYKKIKSIFNKGIEGK